MVWVKGQSGNPRGINGVTKTRDEGATFADKARDRLNRQAKGRARGVTNADDIVDGLIAEARQKGGGADAQNRRHRAIRLLLEWTEAKPTQAQDVRLQALMAQVSPVTVPWNDSEAAALLGLELEGGEGPPALPNPMDVPRIRGDAQWAGEDSGGGSPPADASGGQAGADVPPVSPPNVPQEADESPKEGGQRQRHGQISPELADLVSLGLGMVDTMRREDPTGLLWRALRATRGLEPTPAPWLENPEKRG